MKDKENARADFIAMIEKSWTFGRLTEAEKSDCMKLLTEHRIEKALKGSYMQRWEVLNAVYYGFLVALGYARNVATWREETPESIPFSQP